MKFRSQLLLPVPRLVQLEVHIAAEVSGHLGGCRKSRTHGRQGGALCARRQVQGNETDQGAGDDRVDG
eukprot:2879061-Pyramimonas_sp.AAC.1